MKRTYIFVFILLSISVASYANQVFSRNAESSVSVSTDPTNRARTIVNSTYAFGHYFESRKHVEVLLSKKIESVSYSESDSCCNSNLEVTAWITNKTKFDTKMWTITDNSDEGSRWGNFYRTTKHGCCDAEDVQRYYNFKTGKHLFSSTTGPVFAEIPNTPIRRSISFISVQAASDFTYRDEYPNSIGVLTMTSDDSTIDTIIIEAKNENADLFWSPKLLLINDREKQGKNRLSLWNSKEMTTGEGITGFSVKIYYYGTVEIFIPVKNDKFDLENAQLPESITVRRI